MEHLGWVRLSQDSQGSSGKMVVQKPLAVTVKVSLASRGISR